MAETLYDLDGFDVITTALRDLINEYPKLDGDTIAYAVLPDDTGKAMFPTSGGAIQNEIRDVTGYVEQTCIYPFIVVYRANGLSENQKAKVKEWLDDLGRWLERQPITIGTTTHKLDSYPALTSGREFTKIARTSPAYLDSIKENGAENWAINITATYKNVFNFN